MKVSDFGTGPKFACQFTDCKVTGPEDKMWNIKGTVVVLCGQHAYEARNRGKFTYRLSQTISFLQEKAEETKEKADHFFASIGEIARRTPKRDQR